MTALDYILDGLEAELALERELGVRSFECDRELLVPAEATSAPRLPVAAAPSPVVKSAPSPVVVPAPSPVVKPSPTPIKQSNKPNNQTIPPLPLVFLHDKPLAASGVAMIEKIVAALGKTPETAPIVVAPPVPKAKAYVVLGALALRKWFPGKNVAPGQRFTSDQGDEVLVTYSPEYILRFSTVTPAVKKIKQDMWNSLKALNRAL